MQTKTRIPRIEVACSLPSLEEQAARLAQALGLSARPDREPPDLVLHLTEHHLELLCPGNPELTGPVLVEFVTGAAGYRRRHGGHEMLLRAVGLKSGRPLSALDTTGGLGRDAFILASHGCTVHIVERHPVIGALLADGLRRALQHPETQRAAARITLTVKDSRQVLAELASAGQQVDAVYLDPMFPRRSKSAKVKKELQMLQMLAGVEEDNGDLLAAALRTAAPRVVVKRPKGAPTLPGPPPAHSHVGTTTRFDVYLRPGGNRNPEARP
ncbi:MAG: class I SAM-dependent methyltransferase [Desulfobulbaceae bacterium]